MDCEWTRLVQVMCEFIYLFYCYIGLFYFRFFLFSLVLLHLNFWRDWLRCIIDSTKINPCTLTHKHIPADRVCCLSVSSSNRHVVEHTEAVCLVCLSVMTWRSKADSCVTDVVVRWLKMSTWTQNKKLLLLPDDSESISEFRGHHPINQLEDWTHRQHTHLKRLLHTHTHTVSTEITHTVCLTTVCVCVCSYRMEVNRVITLRQSV